MYVDAAKQNAGPISEGEVRQKCRGSRQGLQSPRTRLASFISAGEARSEPVWRDGVERGAKASTLPQFAQTTAEVETTATAAATRTSRRTLVGAVPGGGGDVIAWSQSIVLRPAGAAREPVGLRLTESMAMATPAPAHGALYTGTTRVSTAWTDNPPPYASSSSSYSSST